MTTSHSIHDYPEHLNPFSEDDNHNKIRFWTIGRKLNRSNSINFSGIKELKNSWAFRSFMKKGKKGQQKQAIQEKQTAQTNGNGTSGESPIMFRRALQYSSMSMGSRSTVASPERYVYGGSVTPLPRSRFQERLRSASHHEVNGLSTPRLARSEVSGSRLSVESTNPFDEPVAPARRRKKKRAPAPPGIDVSTNSEASELHIREEPKTHISEEEKEPNTHDVEIEEMQSCSVELKIIEDAEVHSPAGRDQTSPNENLDIIEESVTTDDNNTTDVTQNGNITEVKYENNDAIKTADSIDDILKKVSFPKVNIAKYRRNSSVNEDDVRLRRGNLEDFHSLSTKRSKSLTNDLDTNFVTYDINLNESIDSNGNEPQRVVCKLLSDSRKQSIETISSTEKEFIEIDKATREFEMEISKLTSALHDDDVVVGTRLSVSDIRRRFDGNGTTSPNPIPKPRRSHYGGSISPINGNYQM